MVTNFLKISGKHKTGHLVFYANDHLYTLLHTHPPTWKPGSAHQQSI
jgi:hypothetical protein